MRDLLFQPKLINSLAQELTAQAGSITPLTVSNSTMTSLPSFSAAVADAIARTNAYASGVQAYAERVACNSVNCLHLATADDGAFARSLEKFQ